MLAFGFWMVTPQLVAAVCDCEPPGHSAESNTPPLLLFTVKVKRWLAHLQMPPLQWPVTQSPATPHVLPKAQSGHVGPPQSTSVSRPFLMPSLQVGAAVVLVVDEVEVLVVDVVDVLVLLVDEVEVLVDVVLLVLEDVVVLVDVVDEVVVVVLVDVVDVSGVVALVEVVVLVEVVEDSVVVLVDEVEVVLTDVLEVEESEVVVLAGVDDVELLEVVVVVGRTHVPWVATFLC